MPEEVSGHIAEVKSLGNLYLLAPLLFAIVFLIGLLVAVLLGSDVSLP